MVGVGVVGMGIRKWLKPRNKLSKRDLCFVLCFDIGSFVFLFYLINMNLSNLLSPVSGLDIVLYNFWLVFPSVAMTVIVFFDLKPGESEKVII